MANHSEEGLIFFRSAIRRRPSPRAASRSFPCASSTTSSLAGRRRPRTQYSPSARRCVGRRDAEAEAELQAIEVAYAAESGKRRQLPDWSKALAPASVCPWPNPVPSPPSCQVDFTFQRRDRRAVYLTRTWHRLQTNTENFDWSNKGITVEITGECGCCTLL
ncbi:uncharacterized protein [Aegilops tauschii subsp. strangulata]|uniref:uncharacterized protein isoform X3 n=1 Tax=Aegilops tauschii subsp. strangulata TaxID=200361 RepID=UPI0008453D7F|nr:uncharacterized protein LOC109782294 isoform X3 [Aegilops tauschii subsp. strangulata]XP_020196486.1 uncharacterized protein LOC109782294 isoform X3 [Aegilops tauschii subsp. strangulata]